MRSSSPSARRRAAATAMPISPTSTPPPRRSPQAVDRPTVVVTKSTVPVGTGREVARILREARPAGEFDVASNPEFLREGSAIGDFMRPDRVVIGAESERAREVMRRLYRPLYLIETPIVFTSIETAELIKYAANTFLATKITFINEIADLCEKVGADVHDVARGHRPRRPHRAQVPPRRSRLWRLLLPQGHAGAGQDRAGATARRCTIVETVVAVNDARKRAMAERVIAALRRLGHGQDGRRAGPHLQAEHRRHARQPEPRHPAGPGRRRARRSAPSIPRAWTEAKKLMPDVVYCRRRLRLHDRRRCGGRSSPSGTSSAASISPA